MKRLIGILWVVTMVIAFSGCSNEQTTTPFGNGGIDLSKGLGAIQTASNGSNLVAVAFRRNASDGQPYDTDQQWLYCFNSGGSPAAPAAVTVNSNSLITTVGTQAGNTLLTWNGANHIWSVTGAGSIPSYSDTIASLNRFSITEPDTKADTIFRTSGVTVTWDSPGSVDSVGIVLEYNTSLSRLFDTTAPDTTWRLGVATANSGSYTFSSSQLTSMPTKGFVEITVVGVKSKTKTVSGVSCRVYSVSASKTMCPCRN